jgi:hypothetical protein
MMKNGPIAAFLVFVGYLIDERFNHGQYVGALGRVSKQLGASFGWW